MPVERMTSLQGGRRGMWRVKNIRCPISTDSDVSKHIALVPLFRESEIDSYFRVFERIAIALQWPTEVWPLLLWCKLHGKAQQAIAALSLEDFKL